MLKNWWFQSMVQKTLESSLDSKEIKPVNPKGNQPWLFIRRTNAEAEVPILWPPDAKSRLLGKDPDAGKDWGQEEKGQQRMRWLMASLTQCTWVWASSRREGKTGKPGVLQPMTSQIVGRNWVTEQQQEIMTHSFNEFIHCWSFENKFMKSGLWTNVRYFCC